MKEQKLKPYDIFTFKPYTHPFIPELDECLATLHSFSFRFSCSFWLKKEFYLLVESMLIGTKVNVCNERLRNWPGRIKVSTLDSILRVI